MFQLERRVASIPSKDAESGLIAGVLVKVGKCDFALEGPFLGERRDENQIAGVPSGALRGVGGLPLFQHEMAEDAPKNDDGQLLVLKLNKEDAPRLPADERPQLMDTLNLGRVFRFQPNFFCRVLKSQIFEVVLSPAVRKRPFKVFFEKGNELVKILYRAQLVGSPGHTQLISIQHLRTGVTPMGACSGLR